MEDHRPNLEAEADSSDAGDLEMALVALVLQIFGFVKVQQTE